MNPTTLSLNGKDYQVLYLLGKGKGGHSYLVTDGSREYVLKRIHHEPCDYHQFGNKLERELRDYETLRRVGIPLPRLLEVDVPQEHLLKEYICGPTITQLVSENRMQPEYLEDVQHMCCLLCPAGLNSDYYPTNFVVMEGRLWYIDYECNSYDENWNFENWGRQYWQTPAE